MRITIATGPLLPVPPLRGGAIPRMWHGLAREFARRGHAVCMFARAFQGQKDDEFVEGLRFVRRGGFDQGRSTAIDLVKDLAYAVGVVGHLPEADILVTNDFWLPVFARRARTGRVVVNANRFPKGQYFLYGRTARIAAASSSVRDAIVSQAPRLESRIRVYPNPVDTQIMFADERAKPTDPRVLLYAGRLHPEKGVHVLIQAFARLSSRFPDWCLRIVGPWRTEEGGGGLRYLQSLSGMLEGLPAQILEPKFDPEALAAEYRAASLFCYPSLADRGESFGLAVLEAMACGTPPLVSAIDCFRDFVEDGVTGWVFDHRGADTVSELAAALKRILEDPVSRERAARRASTVGRRFGYAEIAERYIVDFQELIGTSGDA